MQFGHALRWSGVGLAVLAAGYALAIQCLTWFGDYMSEGVLATETRRGSVLVALSDRPAVRSELIRSCRSSSAPSVDLAALMSSHLLAEVPAGTPMLMEDWGGTDPQVGSVIIAAGHWKGRRVQACRGQFYLLHAWP